MSRSLRSVVQSSTAKTEIVLNLHYNKNKEQVIKSIAHEIAHVLNKSDSHGHDHKKLCNKLVQQIKQEYENPHEKDN
jgi:uncharacterized protein (UPF0335 family)